MNKTYLHVNGNQETKGEGQIVLFTS